MNFTFKDLYNKLNSEECINDYDSLISFENKLEELIQEKIKLTQEECKKYKELINKNSQDKESFVSLLTEKFDSSNYDKEKYPNYDNFYYTDYSDEEYFTKELGHRNINQLLMINKYLEYSKNKQTSDSKKNKEENYYSLDNLNTFISAINLFNEKYSHLISRDFAEGKLLEDDEVYRQNSKTIDKFITFFNKLQESENKGKKDSKGKTKEKEDKKDKKAKDKDKEDKIKKDKKKEKKDFLQLTIKNHLSDVLLDPSNSYGQAYIDILNKFIGVQNNELSDLLDKKIIEGKIDPNSTNKINIQQIKEDEIFTFNLPDKFSFINETFNSAYRKIIDNKNYEIYNQYEIDFNSIEDRLTDLLLKNKKLLNDDIIQFSYNNELFTNEVSNVIITFKDNYNIEKLTMDDKEIIYKFYDSNESNKDLYKKIIDDFMTLIKYLVNNKEENVRISDINTKLEKNISTEFLDLFRDLKDDNKKDEKKKNLTVNKTTEIFEYFLKLIFSDIKDEIEEFKQDYKDKKLEKKTKDELEKYFGEDSDKKAIEKNSLLSAIKWFMALVLFGEKDKENKIKENKKNLFDYLNVVDLWKKDVFKDSNFNKELNALKKFNIQINKIVWLYDNLAEEEEEEELIKEIKEYIEKKYANQNQKKPKKKGPKNYDDSDNESEEKEDNDDDNKNEEEEQEEKKDSDEDNKDNEGEKDGSGDEDEKKSEDDNDSNNGGDDEGD